MSWYRSTCQPIENLVDSVLLIGFGLVLLVIIWIVSAYV